MLLVGNIRQAWIRFSRRKARRRAVQEFRRSLALIVDREALESSVAARLKEIFDPDRLAIFQVDPRARHFQPTLTSGLAEEDLEEVEIPVKGRLVRWLQVNETCLLLPRDHEVLGYLDARERELLTRLDLQLCAPLIAQNQVTGMVLLGASRKDRVPDQHDADLLQILMEQASLAFQTATLYREQQERLERLHRADRLSALGQLAASVAHEVRNPLTAIRSTIQYLGRSFEEGGPEQALAGELISEVDRIDSTVSGLLSLTHAGELRPTEVDVVKILEQTVRLTEIQARKHSIEIEERYLGNPLRLLADGPQLKQVFLNLILNAIQAMPGGGRIGVEATLVPAASGKEPFVCVRISDNGPGIAEDQLERVFDPFFTTKKEGTGLGLSVCHNIVGRHKGEMELDSKPGRGTRISVFFPVHPSNRSTITSPDGSRTA